MSLLLALPGYLAGDVRYAGLALMTLAAVLAWLCARDRVGRAAAVMLVLIPGRWYQILGGWTEILLVGALAVVVYLAVRRHPWLPYALGLLLVSKQYFGILLPVVLLLAPTGADGRIDRTRLRGFLGRVVLSGALVTVPFVLWSVRGSGTAWSPCSSSSRSGRIRSPCWCGPCRSTAGRRRRPTAGCRWWSARGLRRSARGSRRAPRRASRPRWDCA